MAKKLTARQRVQRKHRGAYLRHDSEHANWNGRDDFYRVYSPVLHHGRVIGGKAIGKGETARAAWADAASATLRGTPKP